MSKRADPPTRWKTIEELTVEEHLQRMQAMNRGEPEPRFESEAYLAAKRLALAGAGLEPDDDGPPPNLEELTAAEEEAWLRARIAKRRSEAAGESEPAAESDDLEAMSVDDHLAAIRRQQQ